MPKHFQMAGCGKMDWEKFMSALMEPTYRGSVCIEVEDDMFGKTLEGRKGAVRVAGNVLRLFFAD